MPPAMAWAESGLMHLSGFENGAPVVPEFDFMGGLGTLLAELREGAHAVGASLSLDSSLLTERARLLRFSRGGTRSCNRTCRLLEARDGWIALNLPRADDVELLPAWLGIDGRADPWSDVERCVRRFDRRELEAMAEGLPLALASVPDSEDTEMHVPVQRAQDGARPFAPLVLDLSVLWAGPLCAQLLRKAGARVIKVESAGRLEPMRQSCPRFHDELNGGKESVILDVTVDADRRRLRRLVAAADIVISSARPRAFEQLGLDVAELARRKPSLIWIGITAYGWHGANCQRIGFGDDVAAAAGLVSFADDGRPVFLGDAVADPLAGIVAASTALNAWREPIGGLQDVSLCSCARRVALSRRLTSPERGRVHGHHGKWWLTVDGHDSPVVETTAAAAPLEQAAEPGAHTQQIIREFC